MSSISSTNFDILASLQRLGRSLMLPIAVLPVAGLLLRLGSPDVFDINFIKEAGAAIFAHLPLIFAIGVAIGTSKDNAGAAAMAGGIGYLVLTSGMKALDKSIDMGVLAGIISGITAGFLYNKYHQIELPDWLGFFSGKRFVPIVTGAAMLILALAFGFIWPPVQQGINAAGQWVIESGEIGAFSYGVLNRLLIPTGLHQVINSVVWFVFGEYNGANGDLGRFFAGDPTAGTFMAGFYPIMIFGLPAACLAMYRCSHRENRKLAGGALLGVALTSLITGVTEPVEFLFMFLAPVLYLFHALFTGLSLAVCSAFGIKAGFTFSAGAIDLILNAGLSTNLLLMIPICLATFTLYYFTFTYFIVKFDLKTPGRQKPTTESAADLTSLPDDRAGTFIEALGGKDNLITIESCITRLRLQVRKPDLVDKTRLKNLGAKGVIHLGKKGIQVIIGTQAEKIAEQMRLLQKAN